MFSARRLMFGILSGWQKTRHNYPLVLINANRVAHVLCRQIT